MEDIDALSCIAQGINLIVSLPQPPDEYDNIKEFEDIATKKLTQAMEITQKIASYGQNILTLLEEFRLKLNESTKMTQTKLRGILHCVGKEGNTNAGLSDPDHVLPVKILKDLQEIEMKKLRLQEAIIQTQIIWEQLQDDKTSTFHEIEELNGTITFWIEEREVSYRVEQEILAEEKRKIEEEEKRKKEEEEKRKIEEEEKRKIEEEEKQKKKEEIMREVEEAENRRKHEVQIAKRVVEDPKRHKNVEQSQQLDEMQDKEIQDIEIDAKQVKDHSNWMMFTYKRPIVGDDCYHQGVCCLISVLTGSLDEENIECTAFERWMEGNITVNLGDKLLSSLILVKINNRCTDQFPIRVYVPHCSVADTHCEEVLIIASIEDRDWEECRTVHAPVINNNLNLIGIEITKFETMKLAVIARVRRQEILADVQGFSSLSQYDKNVKIAVPKEGFSKPTRLMLAIRHIRESTASYAVHNYDSCRNILSVGTLLTLSCQYQSRKDLTIDLIKRKQSERKGTESGKQFYVLKTNDEPWRVADTEHNDKKLDASIKLPRLKSSYILLEIEARHGSHQEDILKAAEDLHFYLNGFIVRMIAKQNKTDPSMLTVQCVRKDLTFSRLEELEKQGYSLGPDVSKDYLVMEDQRIKLITKGNIKIVGPSTDKMTIPIHSYLEMPKLMLNVQVGDKFKQKDLEAYIGNLHFDVYDNKLEIGSLPAMHGVLVITLPKAHDVRPRTAKARLKFPYYYSAFIKFLAMKLTQTKDDSWLQVLLRLAPQREVDMLRRRAATQCNPPKTTSQQVCEIMLHDWMKSKPVKDDKIRPVLKALEECKRYSLLQECKTFVHIQQNLLSDSNITQMTKLIGGNWKSVALGLGLSNEIIEEISTNTGHTLESAFEMLCTWRVSDTVISSGVDLFADLLERLESTRPNQGFINYIKQIQGDINQR